MIQKILTSSFTLLTLVVSSIIGGYNLLISTVDSKDDRVIEMMRHERSIEIKYIKENTEDIKKDVREMKTFLMDGNRKNTK